MAVIVAPGTAAPAPSVRIPVIWPPPTCAATGIATSTPSVVHAGHRRRVRIGTDPDTLQTHQADVQINSNRLFTPWRADHPAPPTTPMNPMNPEPENP